MFNTYFLWGYIPALQEIIRQFVENNNIFTQIKHTHVLQDTGRPIKQGNEKVCLNIFFNKLKSVQVVFFIHISFDCFY